jgi:hypothetical protein
VHRDTEERLHPHQPVHGYVRTNLLMWAELLACDRRDTLGGRVHLCGDKRPEGGRDDGPDEGAVRRGVPGGGFGRPPGPPCLIPHSLLSDSAAHTTGWSLRRRARHPPYSISQYTSMATPSLADRLFVALWQRNATHLGWLKYSAISVCRMSVYMKSQDRS